MRTASNLRLTLICFFLNVFWCGHSKSDASTIYAAKRGTFDEEKVNYYKWSYEKLTRAHIYILVLQVCTISLISEKCLYFFFSCPIVFNPLHGFTYGGQNFEAFFCPPKKSSIYETKTKRNDDSTLPTDEFLANVRFAGFLFCTDHTLWYNNKVWEV